MRAESDVRLCSIRLHGSDNYHTTITTIIFMPFFQLNSSINFFIYQSARLASIIWQLIICPSVSLPIYLSICLSVCLSIYLHIYISINLSMPIYLFYACLPIYIKLLALILVALFLWILSKKASVCQYIYTLRYKNEILGTLLTSQLTKNNKKLLVAKIWQYMENDFFFSLFKQRLHIFSEDFATRHGLPPPSRHFLYFFITLGMIRNKVNPLIVKYFHCKKKQQSMGILQVWSRNWTQKWTSVQKFSCAFYDIYTINFFT